ncbi:hypothetical protein NQD34_010859, partial [Periophthalmus magnuspinnatus]
YSSSSSSSSSWQCVISCGAVGKKCGGWISLMERVSWCRLHSSRRSSSWRFLVARGDSVSMILTWVCSTVDS